MSPAEAEKKAREMLVEHIQDDKFGMGWNVAYESLEESIAAALLQAVEAEREACAAIADEWGSGRYQVQEPTKQRFNIYDLQTSVNTTGRGIAEDIRARGKDNA